MVQCPQAQHPRTYLLYAPVGPLFNKGLEGIDGDSIGAFYLPFPCGRLDVLPNLSMPNILHSRCMRVPLKFALFFECDCNSLPHSWNQ